MLKFFYWIITIDTNKKQGAVALWVYSSIESILTNKFGRVRDQTPSPTSFFCEREREKEREECRKNEFGNETKTGTPANDH